MHNSGNSTAQSNAVAQIESVKAGNMSRIHGYFNKYFLFRRFRPESAGLFTHLQLSGVKDYGWPDWYLGLTELLNDVVADNKRYFDVYPAANKGNVIFQPGEDEVSYTLHQQNRTGAPSHPSYPAAHSYIGGAGMTIIKFVYDCEKPLADLASLQATGPNQVNSTLFPVDDIDWANSDDVEAGDPVYAVPAGEKILIKKNVLGDAWTVNTEINKAIFNKSIGRGWLGLHYHSDNAPASYAGEAEGIRIFQDILTSWYQDKLIDSKLEAPKVSIITLDGTRIFVTPTSCTHMVDGKSVEYKCKYLD